MTIQSNIRSNSNFTLWWSLAFILSWTISFLVLFILGFVLGDQIFLPGIVAGIAVFGGLLAISQKYVFSRFDIEMRNWTLRTLIAGWVGYSIAWLVAALGPQLDYFGPQNFIFIAIGGITLGAIIGLAQRKKVAPENSQGWIWVLTNSVAMGLVFVITVYTLVVPFTAWEGGSLKEGLVYGISILGLIIGSGLYGLITAQVLLRMPSFAAASY